MERVEAHAVDEFGRALDVPDGEVGRFAGFQSAGLSKQSQRTRGTVKFRWEVLNQDDDVVCSMIGRQHYVRRTPAAQTS